MLRWPWHPGGREAAPAATVASPCGLASAAAVVLASRIPIHVWPCAVDASGSRIPAQPLVKVSVQLFAAARQLAGQAAVELELPEPATVAQVRAALRSRCPQLERLLPHARLAVNAEYAGDDAAVRAGDALALIPPVSGG